MKCIDLIAAFELEINRFDDAINKPVTDDTLYWINQAIIKFIKERFNGNLPHRTSYEQNEKRTRDLINLYEEKVIQNLSVDNSHPSYNSYEYTYPSDMMFVLNEDVIICDKQGNHEKDVSIFECTADSFMYRIMNSLTDFHYKYHNARPLRVRTDNGFRLLTDKKYNIKKYTLGYLKTPEEIKNTDPYKEYVDFPEYIWPEIVKIAALMYIENQADPRYKTLTNEVLTQE